MSNVLFGLAVHGYRVVFELSRLMRMKCCIQQTKSHLELIVNFY